MDKYKSSIDLPFKSEISTEKIGNLKKVMEGIEEVRILDVNPAHIKLEYSPYKYGESYLKEMVQNQGIEIINGSGKPGKWQQMIQYLIRENKKNFGTKKLNCCAMHNCGI
jgi:hypothetical protein